MQTLKFVTQIIATIVAGSALGLYAGSTLKKKDYEAWQCVLGGVVSAIVAGLIVFFLVGMGL